MVINEEINKIDIGKLIVKREKAEPTESWAPDERGEEHPVEVVPPNLDQAELGVEAGAISENPAQAYRQGFIAGERVRKATPGAAKGLCWNCHRDPHPPSHAQQVEMLKEILWARQLPIYMWPAEEFDRLLEILDGLGEGAYLAGAKACGPIYYSE